MPSTVIRPRALAAVNVNHRAPSEPVVMLSGAARGVIVRHSVNSPSTVIRPIALTPRCANQSAPSGPTVIPVGVDRSRR